ncbi:MAG: thioesterase family protein [Spirochaetales bacterium]|nr:thioesterase family protein [Spirochaetales bacterium]
MDNVIVKEERKLEVEIDIHIKGYEIDVMGIVSNINYLKYFEDIRTEFLERYYPFDEMMKIGISPILMHSDVDYKVPLTIFDKPKGYSWVTRMDRMRWEFNFEIKTGDTINATGVQSGTFYNMERKRPVPIPERLKKLWIE